MGQIPEGSFDAPPVWPTVQTEENVKWVPPYSL
jgi:hypothetical protein